MIDKVITPHVNKIAKMFTPIPTDSHSYAHPYIYNVNILRSLVEYNTTDITFILHHITKCVQCTRMVDGTQAHFVCNLFSTSADCTLYCWILIQHNRCLALECAYIANVLQFFSHSLSLHYLRCTPNAYTKCGRYMTELTKSCAICNIVIGSSAT